VNEEISFIPDRLNEEPVVFLSMTNSEIKLAVIACFVVWLPVCLIIGFALGYTVLGLAGTMLMTFLSMYFAGRNLTGMKRNRPKQYHVMIITAWLEDKGVKTKTMIRENKTWDMRRSPVKVKK